MSIPEKSSDEILKELFVMCQQRTTHTSEELSQSENSDDTDSDSTSRRKKHKHKKKKKKKHKNLKKRKNEELKDGGDSDDRSHKRKMKIKTEPETPDDNTQELSKVELKIVKEENVKIKSEKLSSGESLQNKENKSNNYINTVTGMSVTLDDVFNTLGIVTKEPATLKIKEEKEDGVFLKKEKIDTETRKDSQDEVEEHSPENENGLVETQQLFNVEDNSEKTLKSLSSESKDEREYTSHQPNIEEINDDNICETVEKKAEESGEQIFEKLEEGEISSDSSSLEDDSADDEKDEKSQDESSRVSKDHRKKSRSHKKRKYRSHSHKKKRHRHKEERSEHKHCRKHSSSDRNLNRDELSKSRNHHNHHHERTRSVSSESERSHKSRSRKEKRWLDRSKSRSTSRTRPHPHQRESKINSVEKIDKQKLLEIARKNALNLLQQGALPASVIASRSKIAAIKAGGKTVDELTDFCKQLSKKEAEGEDSDHQSSENENSDVKTAFHHPFQLKERPSSIVMNIRNAISLPTKTAQEKTLELSKQLSLQYPVSSGQQHQSVWVPVEKTQENTNLLPTQATSSYTNSNVIVDPNVKVSYPLPKPASYSAPVSYPPLPPPPLPPQLVQPQAPVDIGTIVAQRLEAIRRLSENPHDPVGTNLIQATDSKMTMWAESKVQPGLFTGSTGVKLLSAAELSGGFQAWPKKNQFIVAKPVCSDKGESLMKKMGWQPGEGLGKFKQGPAAPCEISLKTDRKGLAEQPKANTFKQPSLLQKATEMTLSKHPVSLLNEFCSRRKLPTPQYDCDEKEGAGRRKLFLFSVVVRGVRYTAKMPSTNKKQSKMEAATVCLQSLGLLPNG